MSRVIYLDLEEGKDCVSITVHNKNQALTLIDRLFSAIRQIDDGAQNVMIINQITINDQLK